VDPVDVARAKRNLDPEQTLVIIVSKSFTTAETMLNARTMRQWLWENMGQHPDVSGGWRRRRRRRRRGEGGGRNLIIMMMEVLVVVVVVVIVLVVLLTPPLK